VTSSAMQEIDVDFHSGSQKLAGTLAMPQSGFKLPVVLMLPGSGQTDRNNNAKQLKINFFPPLVSALADRGIASFRYDKRGVGESGGDYWSCGFHDLLADAKEAVSFLSSRSEIDPKRIFVLGHSEGAIIALNLAASDSGVSGAVLLAGSAKTGQETIVWQTQKIASSLTGLNKLILRLFRIDVVKGVRKNLARIQSAPGDSARIQGRKVNAKWMREFLKHDPKLDLKKLRLPTLALTGSSDVQVDPEDIALMAELAAGALEGKVLNELSHLFRQDKDCLGLKGYRKQAKQPVDPQAVQTVVEWLSSRAGN